MDKTQAAQLPSTKPNASPLSGLASPNPPVATRQRCTRVKQRAPGRAQTQPPILFPHSHSAVAFAWAAGFLDGDGCVSAVVQTYPARVTPSIRIRVVIVQNDYYTLSVFQKVLSERSALNALRRKAGMNKQPYQLQYDGRHAIAVLHKLRPHLVRKAAEADVCFRLFYEGRLTWLPGPKGVPPELTKFRLSLVAKLGRMK